MQEKNEITGPCHLKSRLFRFHQSANVITATLTLTLQDKVTAFDASRDIEHTRSFTAVAAPDRVQDLHPIFRRYRSPELLGRWGKVAQLVASVRLGISGVALGW